MNQRCRLNTLDRHEVREQQRIARGARLGGQDLRPCSSQTALPTAATSQPAAERRRCIAPVRQVGQPNCLVLDVAGVDVDHAVRRRTLNGEDVGIRSTCSRSAVGVYALAVPDSVVFGEASDGEGGFELLAASLRSSGGDLESFVEVLADKLERALPGRVVVERAAI